VITADQLVAHAIGDYLLQSDWMANGKTKAHAPAAAHAIVYTLCFLPFHPSWQAWSVILLTHFAIDRWRLARYVVWAKNWLVVPHQIASIAFTPHGGTVPIRVWAKANRPWGECKATGYPDDRPAWLAVWLLIIADNILHVLINGAALQWL
jgi:uncharacterized protein DUF3307